MSQWPADINYFTDMYVCIQFSCFDCTPCCDELVSGLMKETSKWSGMKYLLKVQPHGVDKAFLACAHILSELPLHSMDDCPPCLKHDLCKKADQATDGIKSFHAVYMELKMLSDLLPASSEPESFAKLDVQVRYM